MKMKISIFLALFLVIISCAQVISNEDEERSLIQSNEQARELIIGNSNGNGNIKASTRLNHKDVLVESQNEHKHELFVTITIGGGGGGRGGAGGGGGGGKGTAGGAATGIIGGGVIVDPTVDYGQDDEYTAVQYVNLCAAGAAVQYA
ncbi:hypothetical protein L195_g024558 [Trifolium pratense]|uniref:Glycine-rich protein n=1 Tax=Trifolium pratense TaxID=57577 RepID=A0A2K3NE06_TRIPR|nr:hypothetical protein L195_g024558 [Trifolium pratense]